MSLVSPIWRRALAVLVIALGLTHGALFRPPFHPDNFMPTILYGVAVVGFTAAGIGVFGLTPFSALVRPLLVVASGYSLVLILILGATGFWWIRILDVALLLTGLTGVYRQLPIGPKHPGLPHRVAVSVSTAIVLLLVYTVVWWRG